MDCIRVMGSNNSIFHLDSNTGSITATDIQLVYAATDANAGRGRSNPTGIYTAASFAAASEIAEAILLKRRIEPLGEGSRSINIIRMNAPIPTKGKMPAITNYIWLISSELAVNKLMTRN